MVGSHHLKKANEARSRHTRFYGVAGRIKPRTAVQRSQVPLRRCNIRVFWHGICRYSAGAPPGQGRQVPPGQGRQWHGICRCAARLSMCMQYYHIRTPEYVYAILSHTARLSMCSRYYHIRTPEHVYAILSHTPTVVCVVNTITYTRLGMGTEYAGILWHRICAYAWHRICRYAWHALCPMAWARVLPVCGLQWCGHGSCLYAATAGVQYC